MRTTISLVLALVVSFGFAQSPPANDSTLPVPGDLPSTDVDTEVIAPTESIPDVPTATVPSDIIPTTEAPGSSASLSLPGDVVSTSFGDSGPTSVEVPTTAVVPSQTATRTTTATVTGAVESAAVDLGDAVLGENAELGEVKGEPAVVLAPPAWGSASFSIPAAAPKDLPSGEKVKIHATLLVDNGATTQKRFVILRQAGTGSTFSMSLDGTTVHSGDLSATTAGDSIDVVSSASTVSSKPTIDMAVQAGEIPVHLKIFDVSLVPEVSSGGSPGGGNGSDGGGDSGNGGGSGGNGGDKDGEDGSSTSPSSTPTGGQGDNGNMAGSNLPRTQQATYTICFLVALFVFIV